MLHSKYMGGGMCHNNAQLVLLEAIRILKGPNHDRMSQ